MGKKRAATRGGGKGPGWIGKKRIIGTRKGFSCEPTAHIPAHHRLCTNVAGLVGKKREGKEEGKKKG